MIFTDQDVERVARRLWHRVAYGRPSLPTFDHAEPGIQDHYRDMAREALTAFLDTVPA